MFVSNKPFHNDSTKLGKKKQCVPSYIQVYMTRYCYFVFCWFGICSIRLKPENFSKTSAQNIPISA